MALTISVSPLVTSPAAKTLSIDVLKSSEIEIELRLPVFIPTFFCRMQL
jgi:hypothetical protein